MNAQDMAGLYVTELNRLGAKAVVGDAGGGYGWRVLFQVEGRRGKAVVYVGKKGPTKVNEFKATSSKVAELVEAAWMNTQGHAPEKKQKAVAGAIAGYAAELYSLAARWEVYDGERGMDWAELREALHALADRVGHDGGRPTDVCNGAEWRRYAETLVSRLKTG